MFPHTPRSILKGVWGSVESTSPCFWWLAVGGSCRLWSCISPAPHETSHHHRSFVTRGSKAGSAKTLRKLPCQPNWSSDIWTRCQKESSSPSFGVWVQPNRRLFANCCQLIKAEFSKGRRVILQTNCYDLFSLAMVMVLYFLFLLYGKFPDIPFAAASRSFNNWALHVLFTYVPIPACSCICPRPVGPGGQVRW